MFCDSFGKGLPYATVETVQRSMQSEVATVFWCMQEHKALRERPTYPRFSLRANLSANPFPYAFMVICINAAYFFWGLAVQGGNMMVLVLASFFTPVLSTILTVFYLHVAPHTGLWIGCILVVAGSYLCNQAIREK